MSVRAATDAKPQYALAPPGLHSQVCLLYIFLQRANKVHELFPHPHRKKNQKMVDSPARAGRTNDETHTRQGPQRLLQEPCGTNVSIPNERTAPKRDRVVRAEPQPSLYRIYRVGYHWKRGFPPALHLMLLNVAIAAHRTPPMGWSSWNHFGMRVSAPLLLAVADELDSRGLKDSGYVYVNTDDGWNDKNRTAGRSGALHPATTFSNASEGIKALADGLRAKGFRFGIYLAAGFTTCGNRAGSLYYERQDAAQIAAAGVDYLKYDDCGEANLQSYAKYHVMKDALDSAYAFRGGVDYYSFEPFQVYNGVAIQEMGWTATVGDLWRTGGDIRPVWKSIMSNAHANDHWAPNGRPGHYNDADMLEIGNGQLTLAEQRAHFSLWCVQKSPLIIGADVAQLSAESLAILRNEGLIRVNQDELGIQGTLRAATGDYASTPTVTAGAPAITIPAQGSDFVGNCSFGAAAATQRWRIVPVPGGGTALANADGKRFLARDAGSKAVVVSECVAVGCGGAALFDVGRANETLSQIRDAEDATSCLAYDGTSLHMEACRVETGDAANASDCWEHNCRFSSLSDQLFYLTRWGNCRSRGQTSRRRGGCRQEWRRRTFRCAWWPRVARSKGRPRCRHRRQSTALSRTRCGPARCLAAMSRCCCSTPETRRPTSPRGGPTSGWSAAPSPGPPTCSRVAQPRRPAALPPPWRRTTSPPSA